MSTPFLKAPISLRPAASPETPFRRASEAWDRRLGSSVAQARNWRFAFVIATSALLFTTVALMVEVHQQKVIPVIVGLDHETGEAKVVGPVDQKSYQPQPLEIKYFLSQFIKDVRAVSLDPVLIRKNWVDAYALLTKEAAGLLNEMAQKDPNSALNKIGKVLVSVEPLSIVPIPETNSFELRWRETQYSSHGTKLDTYTMLGTFNLEFETPKDEQTIKINPLGIFIKSFSWNREL